MVLACMKSSFCGNENIVKYGKNKSGKQLYLCRNKECSHTTFPEEYTYNACKPEIKEKIFELTVNGNGTRAIGRILKISNNTVTNALKKRVCNFQYKQ
jgi:transposase-like protein